MSIVDFTSYADIRAALGVGLTEIQDTVISLPLHENNLGVELDKLGLSLTEDFIATQSLATKTPAQARFLRAGQLFATYAVAKQLTGSLPLFSPKEIHDGKASMVRYAQNPYAATIAAVQAAYENYKTLVADAYAAIGTSSGAASSLIRPYLVVSAPSYDPVTG